MVLLEEVGQEMKVLLKLLKELWKTPKLKVTLPNEVDDNLLK